MKVLGLAAKVAAVVTAAAVVIAHFVVPARVDRAMNGVSRRPPYRASPAAAELHRSLVIADLHADSLIWGRDLLERHDDRGQVDVPRLIDANVALQVFSVPTAVHVTRNAPDSLNLLTVSAIVQWWRPTSWWNLAARAERSARTLDDIVARSKGLVFKVETADDLGRVGAGPDGQSRLAALLAIEGLHALEHRIENIDRLHAAGFRMMGLVHHFDNEIGGSTTGRARGGLTSFGADVVRRLEARHLILDLAHASPALIRDVAAIATRPLVVSHTGVRGTCNRDRNLDDESLRLIAASGGVIGIGFWSGAVCGNDAAAIARAIRYAADLVGIEHVALGSDFDGDSMPFDVRGIVEITGALIEAGFGEDQIGQIMGRSLLRVLSSGLPPRAAQGQGS